jgi:hypothetical protein
MRLKTVLFLLLSLPLAGQTSPFKFVSVDIPGAVETHLRGVNNYGEIVGFYSTVLCYSPAQAPVCNVHGFKILNGKVQKLDVPSAVSTAVMAVNDIGDVVGFYLTPPSATCTAGIHHGFLWLHTGLIKKLDYPGTGACGGLWTVPMGINRAGAVVGTIWNPDSEARPAGGFVWREGTFSVMNLGEPGNCYSCTGVYGVANRGVIVGTAWRVFGQIPMWTAYLKKGSVQSFFVRSQDDTWATAVNNGIDVIGYGVYGSGWFISHMQLDPSVEPTLIDMQYPGSLSTWPFGLSDQRTIVGAYRDDANAVHGFVATPTF